MKFLSRNLVPFLIFVTPLFGGQGGSLSTPVREYIYMNDRLVAVDTPQQALGAPTGLTAAVMSSTSVGLAWSDNSTNETGFRIERKTGSGGTYTPIAAVSPNITTYLNTGLAANTTYYYRVQAYAGAANSAFSNNVSVTISVPAAPGGLAATRISSSQINLNWIDNSGNETGFKIERKLGAGGTYSQIATVGASVTSFANTGLANGTVYYYRVRAYNGSGDSGFTAQTNACTGIVSGNGTYDGSSGNIVYTGDTWDDGAWYPYPNAIGNTLHYSKVQGDKVTFSFGGDNVTWVLANNTNLGVANIKIDGVDRGNRDTYAPALLWQTAITWNGLGAGNHTIEITVTGAKNSVSSDPYLAVDGMIVGINAVGTGTYDDQHAQLKFIGANWTRNQANTLTYNTTDSYSNATENAVTFAFTGTSLTYIHTRGPDRGKAAITIDGLFREFLDLYSPTDKWQQAVTYSNLGAGIHNIQITVSGQKQAAASNTLIDVDRLHVSPPDPPSAPGNLSAAAVSTTIVNLVWADNSVNETGFRIERKTGVTGTYTPIATVIANTTAYSNSGLTGGTTYYYRVQAYNSSTNSGYTNEASVITSGAPTAPSGLTAARISNSQINLSWTDNSATETEFRIERKLGAGGTYSQIATAGSNVTSFANTGLVAGTVYYYRVRAYNGSGPSAYSSDANACTGVISGTADGNSPNIVYSGTGWSNDTTVYPSYNGTHKYSKTAGDKATFSFSGSSITWLHALYSNMGFANITIDGIDRGNVDQYSSSLVWQQGNVYALGSGNHTITITVTGTKRSASSDTYVDVDAFIVP